MPPEEEVDRSDPDGESDAMDSSNMTVDSLLGALVASIHGVLGADLVGIYLYGSYVSGGFDPGVSDLDLVTVTSGEAGAIDLAGLDRVHGGLVDRHPEWSDRIEIVYIGYAALRSFRTSHGRLAVISPGEPFHLRDERVVEWLQNWYLIRETGVTLYGPPADAMVSPIAWTEFVAAAVRYAQQISAGSLAEASPGALAYSVLTLCRAHRTVQAQVHGSKQEAGAWEREQMPEWAWLIDAALRCRLSRGRAGFDDRATRDAAEEFIALLASRIRDASSIGR
jgi:predicted nucleotidyltransferase